MTAYYNEIDRFAAQWLRELIAAGHIAPGYVDERSIEDVTANDLRGFTQCHFFAGVGVWSHALRQAGWPDNRPVWTGSCPCQPFSSAGKGAGFSDERHLWPAWFHLISQCSPSEIFGEQVASKDGLGWLDLVQTDLEATSYAFGAADLCAAGFGAPHLRQRIYFAAEKLADSSRAGSQKLRGGFNQSEGFAKNGTACQLGDAGNKHEGPTRNQVGIKQACGTDQAERLAKSESGRGPQRTESSGREKGHECTGFDSQLANTSDIAGEKRQFRLHQNDRCSSGIESHKERSKTELTIEPGPVNGFWRNADWLMCRDGRFRPVESGTFPLVNGAAARVGRLRGYGNAIVAEQAKAFIQAFLEQERAA